MAQDKLFTEKSLSKLSSPEQLDQLITVTDKRGWIGLLATALVLSACLIWAYAGRIPVTISGSGILMAEGGIHEVVCLNEGIVKEVKVRQNDLVDEGQVIAVISNPELEQDLSFQQRQLEGLKTGKEKGDIKTIHEMELNIERLEGQLALHARIKSPGKGIITGIMADENDYIDKGTIIATMEDAGVPLQAILFIPDNDAKRIQAGMDVQVAPSTVRKEASGFIRGKVAYVSQYPSTQKGISSLLKNDRLTDYFLTQTVAPLIVAVTLNRDKASRSGYQWSSGKEPDVSITSGTLCNASITVKQIRPISVITR